MNGCKHGIGKVYNKEGLVIEEGEFKFNCIKNGFSSYKKF